MIDASVHIHPGWLADPTRDTLAWPVELHDQHVFVEHPERFARGNELLIGDERLTVERVYGSRLTVQRGVGRSRPAVHPAGSEVTILGSAA